MSARGICPAPLAGALDRFGFVDPTNGGESHRYTLAADWYEQLGEGRLRANVYAIDYRLDLFSNFTYAVDAETLEEFVEAFHEISRENRDRPGLYITEVGWGSQNNFHIVAFEQGSRGQLRQLRNSYRYLMENQRRLNLKQVYWYSWKDLAGSCSFCDSVGLFRAGAKFRPKPSWHAFVKLAGGKPRP